VPKTLPLSTYAAAGYPAVAMATADEDRAISAVLHQFPDRPIFMVAATAGLIDARTGQAVEPGAGYPQAFAKCAKEAEAVLIVLDYQHIVRNAAAYRVLRRMLPAVKAQGSLIVLIAPSWSLPPELEHDIPVLTDSLPSREELAASLDACATATGTTFTVDERAMLLDAGAGETLAQFENSAALSYASTGAYRADIISADKMEQIRACGYLSVLPARPISALGGLGGLKSAITKTVLPAANDPELCVRGLLANGVPGTGKSLAATVIAGALGWPIVRWDVGRTKGQFQGMAEAGTARVFQLADAIAPCVLFIDEIDKAFGGMASSAQTDGGVLSSMGGQFLTWMQERTSRVVVVATCNDYSKLPAEMTRRFNLRFFFDLPTTEEREEIASVHLSRFGDAALASAIAELTADWTGAEIEELVLDAARQTERHITRHALEECAREIKPLSTVRAQEITALREWGKANLRLANSAPVAQPGKKTRKITQPVIPSAVADFVSGGQA
jgi:hypothetical protein